ncbi:hypothetical protein [Shewanella atlantica]|nr:hypothetical protein [Shewanella atlantica]
MRKLLLSTLLLSLLTGCGSDDTNDQPDEPVTPDPEKSKYLTLDIKPEAKFEGTFNVYLGRYADPVKAWLQSDEAYHQGDHTHDKMETGQYYAVDERDAQLAGIVNEPETAIIVDAAKMHQLLMTNPDGLGAGSARGDIFVTGHYSVFDALRYLALTRNDIKLDNIINYDESGRDTYEFTLSWDCNGDGEFNDTDNISTDPGDTYGCAVNYSNHKSQDWHFRSQFENGEFAKARGSLNGVGPQGEGNYERMDQFWIKSGMNIRFQSFSPEMTARRHWVQDREMARLTQNSGKVIVPTFTAVKSYSEAPIVIKDLEVTAHNMRSDIFQQGVITKMDVFLSAADTGLDIAFNYWPTLSTGAQVGSFALFRVDGIASDVGRGWATLYGEMATQGDFSRDSQCAFSTPTGGGQELVVDPEHCRRDWQSRFGGNILHLMSDVWVMNQPVEFVTTAIKDHYKTWGMPEYPGKDRVERDFSNNEDGSDIMTLQVFPLPDETESAVLKPSHFGWDIADCTECHNEQKDPDGHGGYSWPINSSDGFDETQPYYCATCHGNNGAPKAHGETARCFWCHDSEQNRPEHHGDSSTQRIYEGDEIRSNTHIYNHPNEIAALPRDKMGNFKEYDKLWSSVNSDWDMSKVFPDPYSCMTCHQNP